MSLIISMSLYGSNEMYLHGAIINVQLAAKYYPDWHLRIYCSDDVDTSRLDCETIKMGAAKDHNGMFWRFLPIWEEGIERVIVRDTDSRLGVKEAAAVAEWVESGCICHSMHDHEHHRCYPLFGGMFGVLGVDKTKGKIADNSQILAQEMENPQPRVADMVFLQNYIWPYVRDDTLHHSSVQLQWKYRPFPVVDNGDGDKFIGERHQ